MKIVELTVRNFRGIASLTWRPPQGVVCLVGAGDSGKTTIIEAIEAVLYPRWALQFVDSDFYQGLTDQAIAITVTLVDLPDGLLRQDKYGLDLRGVAPDGEIHDEPADDDVDALTIRLRVDEFFEPTWHVVSDRNPDGRIIAARDREMLAAVRLGDDTDRQLGWTRGSALTRITGDPAFVTAALSAAHKKARMAVADLDFATLGEAAAQAGEWGARYGARVELPFNVGIDPRQLNVGTGSLSLTQANGTPARSIGLGSRRLLALAIQRQAVGQQIVMLVDEVEHGLEPHRLRHLLHELLGSGQQVILTSHSDTVVAELGTRFLGVVRADSNGVVQVLAPDPDLQGVLRAMPEALLARRVIVCEGATEYGISRGLVEAWDRESTIPLAARGAMFIDGGGADNAAKRVAGLRKLGFECALWGDSDRPTNPPADDLRALGITCVLWSNGLNTERRVTLDVPEETLGQLWDVAVSEKGEETVASQLARALGRNGAPPSTWSAWRALVPLGQLREAFGGAAAKFGWFKNVSAGERVGTVLAGSLPQIPTSDLSTKIHELQTFASRD